MGEPTDPDSDSSKVDLTFVPTDDLLMEVAKRHGAMVCCFERDDRDPAKTQVRSLWWGPTTWCLGLTHRLSTRVERELEADIDDEEVSDGETPD